MCEHQSLNFWLADEQQTRQAGAALAAALVSLAQSAPVIVFVRGDLGAGKSTLVRGFLARAGINGVMPSPTYSLVEPYQTAALKIFHMDAYRLADATELDYLGLDDIDAPGSILLVEWPDHILESLPKPTLTLDLKMSPHPDRHTPEHGQAHPTKPGDVSGSQEGQSQLPKSGNVLDEHGQAQPNASEERPDSGKAPAGTTFLEDSGEVGRRLSISMIDVPVPLREHLEAPEEWRGLLRVVT